jgi:hypothetical protein
LQGVLNADRRIPSTTARTSCVGRDSRNTPSSRLFLAPRVAIGEHGRTPRRDVGSH